MSKRVFLFGEAEKGDLCTPLRFMSVEDLYVQLGNPAAESLGVDYAIQTLLYNRELIFYRIREEGFCKEDYYRGVKLLYNHAKNLGLSAICIPGVGDSQLIEELAFLCKQLKLLLILTEKDLYDYLTQASTL